MQNGVAPVALRQISGGARKNNWRIVGVFVEFKRAHYHVLPVGRSAHFNEETLMLILRSITV